MEISYHSIAYKEKDVKQLKRAEGSYMKALEIDPDHRGSKKELRKLRRVMEKLGIR